MEQILTVFNVGQGDSFLLHPPNCCIFNDKPLLIDCGPINSNITNNINGSRISIIITHSHSDHIGGLSRILKDKHIDFLFVPYFLPEIITIYKYLRKYLNGSLKNRRVSWSRLKKGQIVLVGEGDELCSHIKIFNPPKSPKSGFSEYLNENIDLETAVNGLRDRGINLPFEDIINYNCIIRNKIITPLSETYNELARNYFHNFFIALYSYLDRNLDTNTGTTREQKKLISSFWEMKTHEASILFKVDYGDSGKWLFTGDADKTVFERLIAKKANIAASFLKVPHHGSKENLNTDILKAISPKVAIISHNNRLFGLSTDPHPNIEVINALDNFGVTTYYTNPVRKNGNIIKTATQNTLVENNLISFK